MPPPSTPNLPAVACYPSELPTPRRLQPFPSPAGHPPPLNTPPVVGGLLRRRVGT